MNPPYKKYVLLPSLMLAIVMWLQSDLACAEPIKQWFQLTPIQQEALRPLASQWDSLPSKLQIHLLLSTKQYSALSSEKKKRFLSQLEKWSKLTPEQRERARQKYIALQQLPEEKREKLKRAAIEKAQNKVATASNVQPASQVIQTIIASQPAITNHQ